MALAPAGAAAADPVQGLHPDQRPGDPDLEETEWTCFSDPTSVSGYEVKRGVVDIPKPAGVEGNITHMEVDVADGNGPVPISRLMLHHIVFFNAGPARTTPPAAATSASTARARSA